MCSMSHLHNKDEHIHISMKYRTIMQGAKRYIIRRRTDNPFMRTLRVDFYRLYGIVIGGICCIKVVAGIRIKVQPLSGFRR